MSLNAVKILEISLTNNQKNQILEEIDKYLTSRSGKASKPLVIFTPNTEQLVFAQKRLWFRDVLNRADISLPDSIGVVWASKKLTPQGLKNPIPGVEFMQDLIKLAENRHVSTGLIGGRGNLAVETVDRLRQRHQQLHVWGFGAPELTISENGTLANAADEYVNQIVDKIIDQNTQVVFVGLGPPKQELLVLQIASTIEKRGWKMPIALMAVGGSFDIISGRLRRSPRLMRNLGLEWLWRLMLEPWRIVRQFALLKFVFIVLSSKFQ